MSDRPPHDYIPDDLRPDLRRTVLDYDRELDILHPRRSGALLGWRGYEPFGHITDYPTLARLKWLLQRRKLLTYTEQGRSKPRDWKVIIVPHPRNPARCFAQPVIPRDEVRREVTDCPPSPLGFGLGAAPTLSDVP